MDLSKLLTILIPTHITPFAPSTEIIENTIKSISMFENIDNCKCIIGCNMNRDKPLISEQYLHNLCCIKNVFDTEIYNVINGQQRKNFLNIIKRVKTPYLFFVEHDWKFVEYLDISLLLSTMDKYKFINTIYFNKRPNICLKYPPCGDFILKPEPRVTEIPLLKTSKWSNNPNITRTSKWKEWMPIVEKAPLDTSNPRKQVEPPLHYLYINQINTLGFDEAHALWGMYSYGTMNNNRMVEHMDGSKRY